MKTFKGEPNLTVRFNPPIGLIKYVQFDDKGEYTTDNERIIQRFMSRFDSVPVKKEEKNEPKKPKAKPKNRGGK
jgi:hypothetical protein